MLGQKGLLFFLVVLIATALGCQKGSSQYPDRASIEGRVKFNGGVGAALVLESPPGQPLMNAMCGEDGHFEFHGVPPGKFTISVTPLYKAEFDALSRHGISIDPSDFPYSTVTGAVIAGQHLDLGEVKSPNPGNEGEREKLWLQKYGLHLRNTDEE
jgi:hypothetical protein